MLNEIAIGRREAYTNPSSSVALAPGAVVVLAAGSSTDPGRIGIVVDTIAASGVGVVAVLGIYSLAKLSTDVYTQGEKVYWDATNSWVTATSNTNANAYVGRVADQGYAASTTTANISIGVP